MEKRSDQNGNSHVENAIRYRMNTLQAIEISQWFQCVSLCYKPETHHVGQWCGEQFVVLESCS